MPKAGASQSAAKVLSAVPSFAPLPADKGGLVQKVVDFVVFLMLGVTAAESFSNGPRVIPRVERSSQAPLDRR
jgi:hypothetical protein